MGSATAAKTAPARNWLAEVKNSGPGLPSRLILHAVEKFGKTSFAAYSPGVIFGMPADETGLLTLIDSGQLPKTPYLPVYQSWTDVMSSIEFLTENDHEYKTFVIDTLNGIEKLCHAHVCQREYGGDWGKKGFASYMQGYEVSLPEWKMFLAALDRLRERRRMSIIALCHTKISTFKNPVGNDFDRYTPAVHAKTWELTHRWADIIMFGNFHIEVEKDGIRSRGKGGRTRVLHTVRDAAYDAGNRHGLPEEIDCGESGKTAFENFKTAMRAGKETA